MKAASAGLITEIESETTRIATCWKIKRRDGQIFTFTDVDINLPVNVDSDGEQIYQAESSYFRSAIQTKEDMGVDNLSVKGIIDAAALNENDIIAGLFDKAEVKLFAVKYSDISLGILKLRRGWLGEITLGENEFEATLAGLTKLYQNTILSTYTKPCRVELGSTECGVVLDPPIWLASTVYVLGNRVKPTTHNGRYFIVTTAGTSDTGEPTWDTTIGNTTADNDVVWTAENSLKKEVTVATVTSNKQFDTSGAITPFATNPFGRGYVTFTSGLNNGLSMEVVDLVTNEIFLLLPMSYLVSVSDTLVVTAGCDKTLETCRDIFDVVVNHRGFPFLPGSDDVTNIAA